MNWRETSAYHINRIIAQHPRNEGETIEQYRKRIYKALRDNYPFAQRSGFAYQCWCEERANILYVQRITDKPPKQVQRTQQRERKKQEEKIAPGQLSLLELTPPHSGRARQRRNENSTSNKT